MSAVEEKARKIVKSVVGRSEDHLVQFLLRAYKHDYDRKRLKGAILYVHM